MTAPRRLAVAIALLVAGAALGAVLTAGGGSSAHAQQPAAAGKTVSAIGTGQAGVTLPDKPDKASIVAAIKAAEAKALPQAVADARERATAIAKAAGLQIGGVQSVDETSRAPIGPFFIGAPIPYPAPLVVSGSCPQRGRSACRAPRSVVVNLSVTFAAS